MRKIIVLVISIFILMISIAVGGCADKNVKVVKSGRFTGYPNVTVGEAFEKFFVNGKWESFKTANNQQIVEFNGEAKFRHLPAKYTLQFKVNGENFEFYTMAINDQTQSKFVSLIALEAIMNDVRRETASK